jgi:hypothetical protein
MQTPVLIYIEKLTPRIDYIFKFIFKNILNIPFGFTTSLNKVASFNDIFINYSTNAQLGGLHIQPHGILEEDNITNQIIIKTQWQGLPIFFNTAGNFLPFDIFGASFYLLTRYEEYLETSCDEHGRFHHTNSLAFKNNFLQQPLINLWAWQFNNLLQQQVVRIANQPLGAKSHLITYDIDMISSYTHKGFKRNWGGVLRAIKSLNFKEALQRITVMLGNKKDPFDTFDTIIKQLKDRQSLFFFLCAEQVSRFDKNTSPHHKRIHAVIKKIQNAGHEVAIHPSYYSDTNKNLILAEKSILERIAATSIFKSRQHYIKLKYPDTIMQLQEAGIKTDYSLGYGGINGYRASTGTPHLFFNLTTNKVASIIMHPFCWMDANSYYEQKLTAIQANEELNHYQHQAQLANDYCTCIWHNFSLIDEAPWQGWLAIHNKFVEHL